MPQVFITGNLLFFMIFFPGAKASKGAEKQLKQTSKQKPFCLWVSVVRSFAHQEIGNDMLDQSSAPF